MKRNEKPIATDDLPKLLLQCRIDRHLSLEQVGQAIGITRQGLALIETGKAKPRRTTRARLIDFLGKHGYFPKAA